MSIFFLIKEEIQNESKDIWEHAKLVLPWLKYVWHIKGSVSLKESMWVLLHQFMYLSLSCSLRNKWVQVGGSDYFGHVWNKHPAQNRYCEEWMRWYHSHIYKGECAGQGMSKLNMSEKGKEQKTCFVDE